MKLRKAALKAHAAPSMPENLVTMPKRKPKQSAARMLMALRTYDPTITRLSPEFDEEGRIVRLLLHRGDPLQ